MDSKFFGGVSKFEKGIKEKEAKEAERQKRIEEFQEEAKKSILQWLTSNVPDWPKKFQESLDFRIDHNPLFKELLSEFNEWYNDKWADDPMGFKKTFLEATFLENIIKGFKKEVEKKREAEEEQEIKKRKNNIGGNVIMKIGKIRIE
ncbi:MAG: hypothetical protein PHD51_01450 [Patescibacteria group bacterium]|nr:hypothetical protein [Patescibacteria group bacterium]MDD5490473.1 hypothetical protein [Patescibacteria group bacterium]